jgi:hypothetical protein
MSITCRRAEGGVLGSGLWRDDGFLSRHLRQLHLMKIIYNGTDNSAGSSMPLPGSPVG